MESQDKSTRTGEEYMESLDLFTRWLVHNDIPTFAGSIHREHAQTVHRRPPRPQLPRREERPQGWDVHSATRATVGIPEVQRATACSTALAVCLQRSTQTPPRAAVARLTAWSTSVESCLGSGRRTASAVPLGHPLPSFSGRPPDELA